MGDHLIEALLAQVADRSGAGIRAGYRRRWRGWRRRAVAALGAAFVRTFLRRRGRRMERRQYKPGRRDERGRCDEAAGEFVHCQRPHSMPVGSSSTGGVTVGVASANWVVLQSPAAAPQVPAKVQGGLLVL